jgi:hypothetical protein
MSKQLARLLKADIQDTSDLKSIAKMLAGKGRGKDTILAHITPREAEVLKEAGGSGTTNPETGLLEFEGGFEDYTIPQSFSYGSDYGAQQPPVSVTPNSQAVSEPVATQEFGYGNMPSQATSQQPTQSQYEVPAGGVQGLGAPITSRFGPAEVSPPAPPSLATRAGDVLSSIKSGGKDILDYLNKNPELAKLGIAGTGSLLNARQAREAAKQVQQSTAEQKALAQPYQIKGEQLRGAAERGELTPQNYQALKAAQAQINQGVESRGGVGVAQAQYQIENLRQQLLQQQSDYGIKLSSIGDQIAIGAIRTGLQADQAVNQLTSSMYSNMLAIASGLNPQQIRTQATQGNVNG